MFGSGQQQQQQQSNQKYAFRHSGLYLVAEHNSLTLHHHVGSNGIFTFEPVPGGHILIKTNESKYVAVDGQHGHVFLAESPRGLDTSFTIEHEGVHVYIRSAHDCYITVGVTHHISAHHHRGHSEAFEQILS